MNKILLILIFQTFLFSSSSILIINSYHKGYDWSDDVVKGIEESLYKHNDIDTNILYMDSKRITSKEYYNTLKNLYRVQLENQKYDLIIAVDRFAYDFVLDIYDQFFHDAQILAVGIEKYSKEKAKQYGLENKVSALLEKRDLVANVKIIETIKPSLKKLYIVNDKSENALHTQPQILHLLNTYPHKYEMIYLQVDSLKELEKLFSKEEEGSAILFIRFYKNKDGKLNKNYNIAQFIKNSKVPIFITDSIFMKKGATGGKIIDLYKLGKTSGKMVIDILSQEKAKIIDFEDLYLVFDENKLEEFRFPLLNLNEKYIILNKKETFFDRNRSFIDFIFRISPLFLFLIIGLIHNIYKRKVVEKKLRQRIYNDKKIELQKQKERQFIIQQSKLAEIGEVFSSIAHQWKSPLVEITAIAQELFYTNKKEQNKNIKEDDSFVGDIMKQVTYMTDTINNFQNFIMPSNKKSDFSVDDAIYSMLDIVNHNMKYNNINIDVSIKKDTFCLVSGYKNEFMQSFLNIINNAKDQLLNNDYKNRNIYIRVFNKDKNIFLEIEDNAGGIDEKNINKIFKPYYTTKIDGHGIGLYMTKMIIEDKMGGKIMVNNINDGVVFSIKLDQNI